MNNRFSFVIGALVLVGLAVSIVVGAGLLRDGGVLEARTTIRVAFADVAGLRAGAPVRLAGLDIGTVASIDVATDRATHVVTLNLIDRPEYRNWIRRDSRFQITSGNLLGDKHVAISFGESGPPLERGELVVGEPPVGFEAILSDLRATVAHTRQIGERLDAALVAVDGAEPGQGLADLLGQSKQALADLAQVATELKAVFDRDQDGPASLRGTLTDLRRASKRAAELMDEVGESLKTADGEPRRLGELVANLDRAASNTEKVTGELRKMLVAEEGKAAPAAKTLKDLEQAAANLREITESTKSMIETMRRLYPPNWFK